jgi:thioredoxin 1
MTVTVNDKTFADEVLGSELPVVVVFGASWCQPCKALQPTVDQLAETFGGVVSVIKADIEQAAAAAQANSVRGVPTVVAFRKGEAVAMIAGGVNPSRLKEFVERQAA